MAARIIHYGTDECHRLTVLRRSGYSVDECNSLIQLSDALSVEDGADAVFFSETEGVLPEAAVSLAKARPQVPFVLFRCSNGGYKEETFDLVIESLTPPQKWLNEVQALIVRSQALQAESQAIVQQSRMLRREAEAVREKSREERERSRRERAKNAGTTPDSAKGSPFQD